MDFAARVRTADGGVRQVLVEIWKAKAPTVVEHLRQYLDQRYAGGENSVTDGRGGPKAVPRTTIYLLGYDLGVSEEAVLDVYPRVTERRTGRVLDAVHPFLEGIHHRSHIVQIPRLRRGGEDELSGFLTIFDQSRAVAAERDDHVLGMEEGEYPSRWNFVVRRLRGAMAEEQMRRYMVGEDLLLRDSIVLAQQVEYERQQADQERQCAERERQQADQERQCAERERQWKEHDQQRTERERQEKEQLLTRAVRGLHGLGESVEDIARALAVAPEEVRRVLSA